MKLSFSGHETFYCRHYWLKKGYDFLHEGKSFTANSAVTELGLGKNMVSSVRFWLRAFGISDKSDNLTSFGNYIFGKQGRDPYIEDIGTIWLLHYLLIKTQKASLYHLVFNELRKEKIEFTRETLMHFIKRKCEGAKGVIYNPNTAKRDISVFIRNLLKPENVNAEEDFGLIDRLQLMKSINREDYIDGKKVRSEYLIIENDTHQSLPWQIVLYCILNELSSKAITVSLRDLLKKSDSVGRVFALTENGLVRKIKQAQVKYPEIVYSTTAGIQEIQFKNTIQKQDVLDDYYNSTI